MTKRMIVGLGNPGLEFEQTRHNVGFLFLDYYRNKFCLDQFLLKTRHKAALSVNSNTILAKPLTYMNLSGEAVALLAHYYLDWKKDKPVALDNLYIVHDDLDIEFGEYKIQFGTGPKVHKGLLSVYQCLGTKQFWHVRIGVDGRFGSRAIPSDKYVLQQLSIQHIEQLSNCFDIVSEQLPRIDL